MEELTVEQMVRALYEKFIGPASKVTPFGVKGQPTVGQVQGIIPPTPLTVEFVTGHWYNLALGQWVKAGPAYLTPAQQIGQIKPPGDAPEGWEWAYNPDTQMVAARRKC